MEHKFCGECGTPLPEHAEFCGECGASLATEPPKQSSGPKRVRPENSATNPKSDVRPERVSTPENSLSADTDFVLSDAITSGWKTSLAWLIGWLPVGYLFSRFYVQKEALNPAWYKQYPLGFDATLAGMTITYSSGALIGGFLAGLSLYLINRSKHLMLNELVVNLAVGWFLLMGISLWVITLPTELVDDGILLITIPILAVLYSGVLAWYILKVMGRKQGAPFSPAKVRAAVISWGVCGFVVFFVAMIVAEFLE